MTNQHPITPPPELVRHWSRFQGDTDPEALWFRIANEAAQWGADHELDACCDWLINEGWFKYEHEAVDELRIARRPNPPSLKKQALEALESLQQRTTDPNIVEPLRRALEALPGT